MLLALLGALVIGISLGLLGSGGSILTVPVLVFVLHRPDKLAIAESLAIVGCIAFIGAFPYAIRAQIHWKSVFFFGLPGMLGAYIGARGSAYIQGPIQLTLFACVMLAVAGIMFFNPFSLKKTAPAKESILLTILEGFLVGCLTGLIGVGGGFLIVPTLVLLSHLPMLFSIGTSLVIISMNSFTGFFEQLVNLNALHLSVNWQIIGMISSAGVLGSVTGSLIAKRISQHRLRQIFGLSILVMGTYILINQF